MTKEEALKILKDCRRRGFDRTTYYVDEYHTARDMAIRALEEQETVTEFADRCRECGAKYGKLLKQEPCEDAISREAVQDLIATWLSDYLTDETREVLETIDYKIGDMPSVYPNIGRWIPVSERMPEKNGNYLITYCYRNEYCHRNEIETEEAAYVYDEDEEEDKWFDITDIEITLAVKAWMPLPDPYKEESEG